MRLLRQATPEDSRAIANVHMLSRREAMPWLPEVHTNAETLWWIENIVLPNQEVWVTEIDEQIVGIAALDGTMLEQLYVLPGHQGQGVGSELLEKAIIAARGTLQLWTFQRNTSAREFYEGRGFQLLRFTDGADNEEHEPDVLYQLMKTGSDEYP